MKKILAIALLSALFVSCKKECSQEKIIKPVVSFELFETITEIKEWDTNGNPLSAAFIISFSVVSDQKVYFSSWLTQGAVPNIFENATNPASSCAYQIERAGMFIDPYSTGVGVLTCSNVMYSPGMTHMINANEKVKFSFQFFLNKPSLRGSVYRIVIPSIAVYSDQGRTKAHLFQVSGLETVYIGL